MGLLDLFRSKTFEEKISNVYEEAIRAAIQQCGGEEFLAGIFVHSSIASTYDTLRKDRDFLSASGLTEPEYEKLMENICKKMLNKYLKSY
ncbi:hypothetical protein H8S77_00795 [Parabacteroides sp. BX2]|uniref:Uncharacterized protein n=1 Tax=Parabacteroides segnis TaxID=2763058 RepID=A0ABR7DVB9_9BACT|nr:MULTISPECIES: hypothetical protein [Parabacteroides]MBC5641426.1 hypothetical protein [Parabacteroides segnis]MCM0711173.1 hypothetical protein [Parabacteroides sp. TA-V-105]